MYYSFLATPDTYPSFIFFFLKPKTGVVTWEIYIQAVLGRLFLCTGYVGLQCMYIQGHAKGGFQGF